jgi:cell division protein FtsZ
MKGAKGVIISITGGEDMRLMEVDEAANHIKDLVDPDANIIWGSAFNNDLEGKIRVSVVATGIDAEAQAQPAAPAKVFAFPGHRAGEASRPMPKPVPEPEIVPDVMEEQGSIEEQAPAEELTLETPADTAEDELLLGSGDMVADESPAEPEMPEAEEPRFGTRSWLHAQESAPAPVTTRSSGTLFERMSNIARGAAKAQVDDEPTSTTARGARDPLDIPRFLNRQNNQ